MELGDLLLMKKDSESPFQSFPSCCYDYQDVEMPFTLKSRKLDGNMDFDVKRFFVIQMK